MVLKSLVPWLRYPLQTFKAPRDNLVPLLLISLPSVSAVMSLLRKVLSNCLL